MPGPNKLNSRSLYSARKSPSHTHLAQVPTAQTQKFQYQSDTQRLSRNITPIADEPRVQDINGKTALHRAIEAGDLQKVEEFLSSFDEKSINIQDKNGDTALHLAVKGGKATATSKQFSLETYQAIIKLLLDKKADIHIQNRQKKTPLVLLKEHDDYQTVLRNSFMKEWPQGKKIIAHVESMEKWLRGIPSHTPTTLHSSSSPQLRTNFSTYDLYGRQNEHTMQYSSMLGTAAQGRARSNSAPAVLQTVAKPKPALTLAQEQIQTLTEDLLTLKDKLVREYNNRNGILQFFKEAINLSTKKARIDVVDTWIKSLADNKVTLTHQQRSLLRHADFQDIIAKHNLELSSTTTRFSNAGAKR